MRTTAPSATESKPPLNRRLWIFFSDEAMTYIRQQAFDLGYVSDPRNKNARGVSAYLNTISRCDFIDCRPDDIKDMDNDCLASGQLPMWSLEYTRTRHLIRLTNNAIVSYYKLSLSHLIANPRHSNSIEFMSSIIGPVIEAIGLYWLQPIDPPRAPQLEPFAKRHAERIQKNVEISSRNR